MINFSFSEYIAIAAIVFFVISIVKCKDLDISKFCITMFSVFTIYVSSIVMIQFSFVIGLLTILSVLIPISLFKTKNKDKEVEN